MFRNLTQALLDLAHGHDFFDEPEHVVARIMDVRGILPNARRVVRRKRRRLHHLGEAENGVERRAELVADVHHELGFGVREGVGARGLGGELDALVFGNLEAAVNVNQQQQETDIEHEHQGQELAGALEKAASNQADERRYVEIDIEHAGNLGAPNAGADGDI